MCGLAESGFTLVELLIVVVVLGVLASVALLRTGVMKERALVSAMRSDLHNYATVQENYASDHDGAYGDLAAVQPTPYLFRLSNGSSGVGTAAPTQWALTITHPGASTTCHLSNNTGAPDDGRPTCD